MSSMSRLSGLGGIGYPCTSGYSEWVVFELKPMDEWTAVCCVDLGTREAG